MNPDTVPGQLESIRRQQIENTGKMQRLEQGHLELKRSVAALKTAVANVDVKLELNTTVTEDIRDLVTAGKVGTRIIKWLGAMAIAGSAIRAGLYAAFHQGKLPHP